MEKLPEKPITAIQADEKEIPQYDFPAESFLNPENIGQLPESNPENKAEGLNASMQYREMVSDMIMEKVLRPNMTDEEIDRLATDMIEEYEAPRAEKAEQEGVAFMERETETIRQEMTPEKEHEMSPLSHMIELISGYLSKHPVWAKTAMGAVVVSELAGCATGGGYYGGYTAQQVISTSAYGAQQGMHAEAYGIQQQRKTEAYGVRHANSQARYAVSHAQKQYRQNMTAEDFRYRQSVMRPLSPQQRQEIDLRHHANIANTKAQYDQEMIEARQRYNDEIEQTQIQSENIRADTEIQRQNIQADTQMQITNQVIQGFIQGMMRR